MGNKPTYTKPGLIKAGSSITSFKPGSAKPGLVGMQARLAAAKNNPTNPFEQSLMSAKERIGLMLDCSGSMSASVDSTGKSRLDCLKEATESLINSIDFTTTALACYTFDTVPEADYSLTFDSTKVRLACFALRLSGSTPMSEAMLRMISEGGLTRGILMSDGVPDSESDAIKQAHRFKEKGIPIDTVHISTSYGEQVLRTIAEITGGIFIKFSDVNSFAKNFKFLAPANRHLLLSGAVSAAALGAASISTPSKEGGR